MTNSATRLLLRPLLLAFVVQIAPSLHAVIVAGGDGAQNSTGSGAGVGWSYVGTRGVGSAVYLGNFYGDNWVLTANHVGAGSFTLGGTTYGAIGGSTVRVQNTDLSVTDLILFKIDGTPGLAPIPIAATTPITGTSVTMIGAGRDRLTALTGWNVTGTNPNYTWTEVGSGANALGYKWNSSRTMRWGESSITSTILYNSGDGNVNGFRAAFTPYVGQAQGSVGDSGGGVFTYNYSNASWELAGLMLAIDSYGNQPSGTAVFGNNTYLADLSSYRNYIVTAIPESSASAIIAGAGVLLLAISRRRRRAQELK
jgi:hypothetical protein